MKEFLSVLVLSLLSFTSFSQSVHPANISYVVKASVNRTALEKDFLKQSNFSVKDQVPYTDIYLIEDLSGEQIDKSANLKRQFSGISYVSVNKKVELRDKVPNDSEYQDQWQLDLLHAPAAWEYGTGGVTCRGDTIVIAVMDAGFDIMHEDLVQNLWRNRAEIPGDGKDNDGNGYKDDIFGLNTASDNDTHDLQVHGTKVAGVLGARGDNNIGVVGINWNSRIMYISYIDSDFYVIKGMHYILTQRRKYNKSNGKEGAFVVSINQSFGISDAFAQDHELWCAMYDSLGKEGVLTAGATTNANKDVESDGDIPSNCTSDFVVIVTSLDQSDKKVSSGYGNKSVDIGAYGAGILSTGLYDSYSTSSGTSFASPQVAGAMALVYSAQCCKLADLAHSDPAGAALLVKSFLLEGGLSNNTLKDITTTGKRLDLNGMMNKMLEYCGNTVGTGEIQDITISIKNQEIKFNLTLPAYKGYRYTVSDVIGNSLLSGSFSYEIYGQNAFEIDISTLFPGEYVLTVWDGEAPVSKKFVKLL